MLPLQSILDSAGLNRHHVFDISDLPNDLVCPLLPTESERQLILFGHDGRLLWSSVQMARIQSENPIDDYSVSIVKEWLRMALPDANARFVFPIGLKPGQHVGLQRLGQLAGWHHASPFFVGVDAKWGSWFAYRAAILIDTDLTPTIANDCASPCIQCASKLCISACEGNALDAGQFDSTKCHTQRLKDGAACALGCSARLACPVGAEHRYDNSQIIHSARGSLNAILSRHEHTLITVQSDA